MPHDLTFRKRSEDEEIKDQGLTIDLDEIGRRGVMSKAEKTIAKWYGIYASRHPGNHMARVVTPGAVMTSAQARNIARTAELYGQGVLNLTTRQAIQFHWLKTPALADMTRQLAQEGSTTKHGCGDVTRQISVCPLAETCQYRRLDVRGWAKKAQVLLGEMRDIDNLPRKFKITFSGCSAACAQPYINCVGLIGVQMTGPDGKVQPGFKVIVGGGLGWDPYIGQELFSFIPEDKVLELCRAVALAYRDHGDRYNRTTSRMKFVVQREGIDAVRAWVIEHLEAEGKDHSGYEVKAIQDSGPIPPKRPLTNQNPADSQGLAVVRLMVSRGELSWRQLEQVAELSERYADQRIYLNIRQNLELHGVDPAQVEVLKAEIRRIGFGTEGFFGLRDMVPCVGTTYCPKAVAETRALASLLEPVVNLPKYDALQYHVLINIAGCPNSCSPWRITDIGFRGMKIREESGSVEGFELTLGGKHDTFGRRLGDFKLKDCPGVVEKVLDTFAVLRLGDETLAGTVARLGLAPFQKAVYEA